MNERDFGQAEPQQQQQPLAEPEPAAARLGAQGLRGLPREPRTLLALQRSAGNAAVSRLVAASGQSGGRLLTDGPAADAPGAMPLDEFVARLREGLVALPAFAQAASGFEVWLERLTGQGAAALEDALRRVAPEAVSASSPEALLAAVLARARAAASGAGAPLNPAAAGELGAHGPVLAKSSGDKASDLSSQDVIERLGSGEPLPGDVRGPMEGAFGQSFSGVELHRDSNAAGLAGELSARAFTVGSHVAFGRGEYAPGTPVGDALIAHELAHVTQQQDTGAVVAGKGGDVGALEDDADRSAVDVVARLWGLARSGVGSASPRLRTGLRLNRCGSGAPVATPAPAPAPPTPAPPAPYAWRNTTLKGMVDGADTPAAILVYIGSVSAADRAIAQEDLLLGRRDYADRGVQPDAVDKMNLVLQRLHRDIAVAQAPGVRAPIGGWAPGAAPAGLTAGTHTPTPAERDRLRDAMVPPGQAASALPDFHSTIATHADAYETRIRGAIDAWVTASTASLVTGKGTAEHADRRKLNPWQRYEQIARVAKEEVDRVFGAYARGPAFVHGTARHPGNLQDRFEAEQTDRAGQSDAEKLDQAKEFVVYILQTDDSVRDVNREHGAVRSRSTLSPGETESEVTILQRVIDAKGAEHRDALLDIDRGWEGVAGGGTVWLQRWRRPTRGGQREHFWDSLQIMMHEYLHTLEHGDYGAYAMTFPGGDESLQYNTLIEGMTSVLTEIAWANVNVASVARRVEGTGAHGTAAQTAAAVPPISNRRYASFDEAMAMMSVVGPQNIFAAFFLGQVDLIRASP